MIGKTPKEHQMSIFDVALESFIDTNHELVLLYKQIDWAVVESEFAEYYCADNGRPSVPIRKMVGMMLLKNIYNLSDEGVVARWMENPYMQYFTGEKGAEKIFKISLMVNAKEITAKEMKTVMIDSTVQEKNITFPTDAKLYRKIIAKVLKMARKEDIEFRRTYTRELKALKRKVRFMNHPTRMKKGKKAVADWGYRGKKEIDRTKISIPSSGSPGLSYYQKTKARKKFCKRAGIEPVIGHLKSDHRMMRNYLKGTLGDAINTLMAAAAYNMRHWMNKNALYSFISWLRTLVGCLENVLFGKEKQGACLCSTLAPVA